MCICVRAVVGVATVGIAHENAHENVWNDIHTWTSHGTFITDSVAL